MVTKKLVNKIALEFLHANVTTSLKLRFVGHSVSAGFPSPADDFLQDDLDFNRDMVKNPSSTFYVRVSGNSMKDAGIDNGDILVVDRSLEPRNGDIAVCWLDGEFTVKTILIEKEFVWLVAQNDEYKPIKVTPDNELTIWGVVAHNIKSFRK